MRCLLNSFIAEIVKILKNLLFTELDDVLVCESNSFNVELLRIVRIDDLFKDVFFKVL